MDDDPLPALKLSDIPGARVVDISLPGDLVACNPSIAVDGSGLHAIVRTVNYALDDAGVLVSLPGGRQMTANWLVTFDRDLAVAGARPLDDAPFRGEDAHPGGFEDCRLFRWRGAWWFSATVVVKFDPPVAKIVLCRLDGARVAECQVIESPSQAPIEKNWMPFVAGRRLGWIYRIDPTELLWQEDDAPRTFARVGETGLLKGWNGSSQCIDYNGRWLCLVHRRGKRAEGVFYRHRFVELTRRFGIRRLSEPFILERPAVEFCAGLCMIGGDLFLSYGVLDRQARLLRIDRGQVERLLRNGPIPRGWRRALQAIGWRNDRSAAATAAAD
jgi:hypothetical protein